jgi:hypothetical protein
MEDELLISVKTDFENYPVIRMKTEQRINIDTLSDRELFDLFQIYTIGGLNMTNTIGCKLRVIRHVKVGRHQLTPEEVNDNIQWVTVEGCDYSIEADNVLQWLDLYGELRSTV